MPVNLHVESVNYQPPLILLRRNRIISFATIDGRSAASAGCCSDSALFHIRFHFFRLILLNRKVFFGFVLYYFCFVVRGCWVATSAQRFRGSEFSEPRVNLHRRHQDAWWHKTSNLRKRHALHYQINRLPMLHLMYQNSNHKFYHVKSHHHGWKPSGPAASGTRIVALFSWRFSLIVRESENSRLAFRNSGSTQR